MDYNAIWNEICFHVSKNRNATEREFQTTVEFMFDKLGWSIYNGEVISQLSIPIGSSNILRPDIVLNSDGKTLLVVELKKAGADLSERNAKQLISYMRQLRLDFGVLLGDTLQVYFENAECKDAPVRVCDIEFYDNSEAGVECIEALSKHTSFHARLSEFCERCMSNPEKYTKKQAATTAYPVISKSVRRTYSGLSGPKRTLPTIPLDFSRTGEIAPILWLNGFEGTRELWDGPDGKKYVIGGKKEFEIFVIVGTDESGKLLADRWYAPQ